MVSEALWIAFIGAAATICAALIALYSRTNSNPQVSVHARRENQRDQPPSTGIPGLPPLLHSDAEPRRKSTEDTKPLEMLSAWVRSERPVPWYWPTGYSNVEVRFLVEELSLGLRCDDRSVGRFRVIGVDANLQEVLHLEGLNCQDAVPEVGLNRWNLADELLRALFHAARCKREHKRIGNITYLRSYEEFLRRVSTIRRRPTV